MLYSQNDHNSHLSANKCLLTTNMLQFCIINMQNMPVEGQVIIIIITTNKFAETRPYFISKSYRADQIKVK